jgi:hypothetical protein
MASEKGIEMLKAIVGTCSTSIDTVVVCEVENPYYGYLDWECAYAAVAKPPNPTYTGHAVAMLVTVYDHRKLVPNHLRMPRTGTPHRN